MSNTRDKHQQHQHKKKHYNQRNMKWMGDGGLNEAAVIESIPSHHKE